MAVAYYISRLFFTFLTVYFLIFLQVFGQTTERQTETSSYTIAISSIVKALPGKANIDSNPHLNNIFNELFEESENCRQKGDYAGALEYDYQALALAEAINLPGETARAYNNIGISQYRIQSFDMAEKFFLLAASVREILKDTLRLADTYCNMGMLYDDLGRFDEAFSIYQKSLELFRLKDLYDGMADVYNGLAGHYYMTGKIDSVTHYATLALDMYTILENSESVGFMQINIGALYNVTGQHQRAMKSILDGIETAKTSSNLNQLRQGYRSLSETYAYMGNFEQAYINYKIYEQYKDSVFNQEKSAVIEELQTKYETDKAQKELSIKRTQLLQLEVDMQKSKNIRNIIVLALIIIIIVTAALWLRYRQNKKTTILLNEKNDKLNELNATKDKFFSIVSHDLKSPVSAVARLVSGLEQSLDHLDKDALKNYLSELAKTTDNLNDFLKKLLSWALSQKGSLKPSFEDHNLCNILNDVVSSSAADAQTLNKTIQMHCDNNVKICADRSMIETVIRNLLSNAVRFADEDSEIQVKADIVNGDVKISISNKGPGIAEEDVDKLFRIDGMAGMIQNHKEKGTGLGLILCYEFVGLHNGTIFLEDNSADNTCFTFTIPIKQPV